MIGIDLFSEYYNSPGFTYARAFATRYCLVCLIFGGPAIIFSYMLYGIAILLKKGKKRANSSVKSVESQENFLAESYVDVRETSNNSNTKKRTGLKNIIALILLVISSIASWYGLFTLAIIPSILSGLDLIPLWSGVMITLTLFFAKYIELIYTLSPNFVRKNREQSNRSFCQRFWKRIAVTTSMYKIRFGIFAVCALAYSITVPLITANTCLNFENEGYGVKFDGFGLSTKLSRYYQLDTVCEDGQICHVYSTLPEDGSNSVILNVHTGADVNSIQIGYEPSNTTTNASSCTAMKNSMTAQSHFIDIGEDRGDRYLHAAYLSGLTNNTMYAFAICFNGAVQKTGAFRTLPSPNLERNFTMGVGGDVGTSQLSMNLTTILSSYEIDAILIGGDISYDNGMKSCYYSMDMFLWSFERLNSQAQRLIPMITSVGNHDVGFNALQGTDIDITQNLYFNYLPRHSKTDSNGNLLYQIPDPSERLSYSYHIVGNTLHYSLDSGYILPYDGVQVDFIKNVSNQFPNLVKIANFHVPVYPTCFAPGDPTMSIPREVWIPVFEQYNFSSVFENHVHLYKTTYPIKNGSRTEDGKGIVYFGDGNWGISIDPCWSNVSAINGNNTGLLEAYTSMSHFWILEVDQENMTHFAVNVTNATFDKPYILKINDYVDTNLLYNTEL